MDFQIYLEERNIQTRVVFTGNILKQPMLKGTNFKITDSGYEQADNVMKNGVLLPVHHGLTDAMFARFQDTVSEFIKEFT